MKAHLEHWDTKKVPRNLRLWKYLLVCGPSKFAAQAALHGGPGTEPRPCMVLGLKPMGKPIKKKKKLQVLDKTKALHGPWTQAYGETNYSDGESPRLKYCKMLRPIRVLG